MSRTCRRRDCGELPPQAGMHRLAQVGRLLRLRRRRRRLGLLQEPPIRRIGIGADLGEDVGPVRRAHGPADPAGRPAERRLSTGSQQQHLIADVQVRQRVCHHHDHAAGIGELAQHRHHLAVQRGIQPRRGLVEDQQRRAGQQLHRHRSPFALAAGEPVHPGLRVRRHLEFLEHLRHHLAPILLGGVRR